MSETTLDLAVRCLNECFGDDAAAWPAVREISFRHASAAPLLDAIPADARDQIERLKRELGEERAKRKRAEAAQAAMVEALEISAQEMRMRDCHHFDPLDICQNEACREARELCCHIQNLLGPDLTPAAARMVRIAEVVETAAGEHERMEQEEAAADGRDYSPCGCQYCKAVRGEEEKP